jgi:hypothetical protein
MYKTEGYKTVHHKTNLLWRPVLVAFASTCCTRGYGILVSTPVHTPYINAYVFRNKLVLSYLLLRLLPHYYIPNLADIEHTRPGQILSDTEAIRY